MKNIIYMLSLLCFLTLAGQAMAYSVTLTPNSQTIGFGDVAQVDVNLLFDPGDQELFGFNFAVNFDPAILRFDNLLFSAPVLTDYVAGYSSPADLGTPGLVTFDGALFSLTGATANIPLASMYYTGIGAGLSQLNLSGSVLDNVTLLETQVGASGSVDIVPPVPEPGTFLLLGVGLAGLITFRRKFHKA